MRLRSSAGFTLLELSVIITVTAAGAHLAALSLAHLRAASNTAGGYQAMVDIKNAQKAYFNSNQHYSPDLDALRVSGLIGPPLSSGTIAGYRIRIALRDAGDGYAAAADPLYPGMTFGKYFFVNETEIIRQSFGDPATETDPLATPRSARAATGTPASILPPAAKPFVGDEIVAAFDAARLEDVRATLDALSGLGGGMGLALAESLATDPDKLSVVLDALDGDASGDLDFDEILTADYVALGRSLVPELVGPDDGEAIGDDATISALLGDYFARYADALRLGDPADGVPPDSPLDGLEANPDLAALFELLAQPLADAQRGCVEDLNSALAKVLKATRKTAQKCVSDHAGGEADAEVCLQADGDERIAKALAKAVSVFDKRCSGIDGDGQTKTPPLFANDPARHAVADAALRDTHLAGLFGVDVAAALADAREERDRAKCQDKALRSAGKCQEQLLDGFVRCKAEAIAPGVEPSPEGARTAPDVLACFGADPKDKLAKVCDAGPGAEKLDKIRKALDKSCVRKDVDLVAALPGCSAPDAEAAHACILAAMRCQACRAVDVVDDLFADCDFIDDGAVNASCL